jgi:virulence-associated protein VagC
MPTTYQVQYNLVINGMLQETDTVEVISNDPFCIVTPHERQTIILNVIREKFSFHPRSQFEGNFNYYCERHGLVQGEFQKY